MKRVVVTGIGAVTPLGNAFDESWSGLLSGISGIDELDRFEVPGSPYKVAGQIRGIEHFFTSKEMNRYDPFILYALVAAREAAAVSELNRMAESVRDSTAVIAGSGRPGINFLDRTFDRRTSKGRRNRSVRVSPYLLPSATASMAASLVARELGLRGECMGISNACASGVSAIGEGFRMIRGGYAEIVLAGGSDAPLCRVCIEGYGSLGVLSRGRDSHASSPFSDGRDGFVLSEGACFLMLESREHALRRNAAIYGEIAGYATGGDSFHQTRPSVDSEAAIMGKAIRDAGIDPGEIGMISAHAASTRIGDEVEAAAIRKVFGERAKRVQVIAVKSATGHMLAASGSFETAVGLMALKCGIVPPTLNLSGDRYDLNIAESTTKTDAVFCLVNSFGFGGISSVLVVKRNGDR